MAMSYGACANQSQQRGNDDYDIVHQSNELVDSFHQKFLQFRCVYVGGLLLMIIIIVTFHSSAGSASSLNSQGAVSSEIQGIELLLLRHALSSWEVPPGSADFNRPLNREGFQEAYAMGTYLKNSNVELPDLIVVSPSLRTQQTLVNVMQNWVGCNWAAETSSIPLVWDKRLYDFHMTEGDSNISQGYIDIVHGLDPSNRRVMLVGHNPAIGQLAVRLTHKKEHSYVRSKFPTAAFMEMMWDVEYLKEVGADPLSSHWAVVGDAAAEVIRFEYPDDLKHLNLSQF